MLLQVWWDNNSYRKVSLCPRVDMKMFNTYRNQIAMKTLWFQDIWYPVCFNNIAWWQTESFPAIYLVSVTYTVCVNKDEETALFSVNMAAFVAISDACQRGTSNLTPVKSKNQCKKWNWLELLWNSLIFPDLSDTRWNILTFSLCNNYQKNYSIPDAHVYRRYLSILKCKSDR